MARWRLVVEGDSGRDGARANARIFVDILRAEGHTVRQVTFYGDAERAGEDLTAGTVPPSLVALADRLDAEDAVLAESDPSAAEPEGEGA